MSPTLAAGSDTSATDVAIMPALVIVTSPNTNVRWHAGATQIIAWNHNLGTSATVKIELTRDNDSSWAVPTAAARLHGCHHRCVDVDGNRPQRRKALMRVTWTADASVNDRSNVTFQIK